MKLAPLVVVLGALGCAAPSEPIVIELGGVPVSQRFEVDGSRDVTIVVGSPVVVEAWADGGALDVPAEQLAQGASASWWVPRVVDGETTFSIEAHGDVRLDVWPRGAPPPPATRERSLAWLDGATLDDPSIVSFARVMAAISDDGHGGRLLQRWFSAFAAGPGAGRATFAQFLDEVEGAQGPDPTAWDLAALPFRVTGVHDRHDLGRKQDCGELRVSIASTHATFSPVHLIFLFRQPVEDDDVTPDGAVHCRGAARRWARLSSIDAAAWPDAARAWLAPILVRDRFLLAESVELSLSPWQWRQWAPDGAGGLSNPPLFQTIDLARVDAPGATRDAFLAEVRAHAGEIDARTWSVPARFRASVAEVDPNAKAPLVDLSPLGDVLVTYPSLPRALGMIGCPRCHTDDADFIQTSVDRVPSPFYDKELDARAARLDALGRGEWPASVAFGPLQALQD